MFAAAIRSKIIFTMNKPCGIILVVKKLGLLTIPVLASVIAAGSITAYAAGGTIYPDDEDFIATLSFTALTDYAIEDGLYVFADGRMVKVYNDGKYSEYAFVNKVLNVAIDEDGIIYCGTEEKAYTVEDQLECEYTFKENPETISLNNYYYYFKDNDLKIFDEVNETVVTYKGYSNLKQFGDKVYAMSENKVYEVTSSFVNEIVLQYEVEASDIKITVGDGASNLKNFTVAKTVEIDEGTYITEIDLENLRGEFFSVVSIVKTDEKINALYLCNTGDAMIVSIKDKAYLVPQAKVGSSKDMDSIAYDSSTTAQMIGGNIYASPYVSSETVSASNVMGITVNVIGKIENDILESAFYEVEYILGEKTVRGYVAEGFLSELIIEDTKQQTEHKDKEYSESTDTKTILIIFAVVVLVIAAIAYIAHVSSKGKKKKKKGEPEEEK